MSAVPCIDLTERRWYRTLGEYTIYGTWFRHDEDGRREPCLVITPSFGKMGKPAVVLLDDAYKFENPSQAAHIVRRFALGMGKESMTQAIALAELINDHLSDLISMPNDTRQREVAADATIKIEGGETRHIQLLH